MVEEENDEEGRIMRQEPPIGGYGADKQKQLETLAAKPNLALYVRKRPYLHDYEVVKVAKEILKVWEEELDD